MTMLRGLVVATVLGWVVTAERAVVPAVTTFDPSRYTGRWYQISANRVVTSTFERGAVCVTADYALASDPQYGTIVKLVNSEKQSVDDQIATNVTGFAYVLDASKPAELAVSFDPPVPPVQGSYWVIKIEENYRYSVVSDDESSTLFVLARNVSEYEALYKQEVDAFLADSSFSGPIFAPVATTQDGCSYPPEPFPVVNEEPEILEQQPKKKRGLGFDKVFSRRLFGPSAKASTYCPSSPAPMHASCDETITFPSTECADVLDEIRARVAGQYDAWHDPHNNGTYKVVSDSGDSMMISLERVTGDGKYTDKINFVLNADDGADCVASACSESQVASVLDFGTNHCNIFALVCGSDDGCAYVKHDFKGLRENIHSCADATTSCLATTTTNEAAVVA